MRGPGGGPAEGTGAGGHLELIGLADVCNLVQGFVKAVQREVLPLPEPVHLQQPPQVAHLRRGAPGSLPAVGAGPFISASGEAHLGARDVQPRPALSWKGHTSWPLPLNCLAKRWGKLQNTSDSASLSCGQH